MKFFTPTLTTYEKDNILTLPGEKMLVYTRGHWFLPLQALFFITLPFLLIIAALGAAFFYLQMPFMLALVIMLLLVSLWITGGAKILANWYFHTYIVTTRRIAELCYVPLHDQYVNGVLLDQVKCTEIDISKKGILSHLLDIGDVSITFDRPTHQENGMTLSNIANARDIASLLTNQLIISSPRDSSNTIWIRPHNEHKKPFLIPDVFPRYGI